MPVVCQECYKKTLNPNAKADDIILSDDDELDLCEGCGQYKPTVIATWGGYHLKEKLLKKWGSQKIFTDKL